MKFETQSRRSKAPFQAPQWSSSECHRALLPLPSSCPAAAARVHSTLFRGQKSSHPRACAGYANARPVLKSDALINREARSHVMESFRGHASDPFCSARDL